jgi:hypothetical protein
VFVDDKVNVSFVFGLKGSSQRVEDSNAKAAKRLRGYPFRRPCIHG